MPAKKINGKKLADQILIDLKDIISKQNNMPGLAAVLIGDNSSSRLYIKLKKQACDKIGIDFHSYHIDSDCPDKKIVEVINFLNKDPDVNGIIVQLPLPKKFDKDSIIKAIEPKKDIDGFHPDTKFNSPNVLGIIELIKSTGVKYENKKITILSNSEKFIKPFKKLLPKAKINHLNPDDKNSIPKLKYADILVVAIGKSKFIKPEMIKKDVILIDVGINKVNGKIIGDIDPICDKKASWRSPVPGGVGPMTIAMLLKNIVK